MKIEKRVLERIGHLTMMEDDGMTKAVMLGWTKEQAGCTFLHLHGVPVDAKKIKIDYFAAKRSGRPMETRGGGSLQEWKLVPFLWVAEWGGPSRPTHLLNQILG